jgi:hypothetical protein
MQNHIVSTVTKAAANIFVLGLFTAATILTFTMAKKAGEKLAISAIDDVKVIRNSKMAA